MVDWSGPRKFGVPAILSVIRNSSPAESSSESSAVLTCFTVVFGFTWAMPIMWYSTPALSNSISTFAGLRSTGHLVRVLTRGDLQLVGVGRAGRARRDRERCRYDDECRQSCPESSDARASRGVTHELFLLNVARVVAALMVPSLAPREQLAGTTHRGVFPHPVRDGESRGPTGDLVRGRQPQASVQAERTDVPTTLPSPLSFRRWAWSCHPAASTSFGWRSRSA